jgi:hypothetical protein
LSRGGLDRCSALVVKVLGWLRRTSLEQLDFAFRRIVPLTSNASSSASSLSSSSSTTTTAAASAGAGAGAPASLPGSTAASAAADDDDDVFVADLKTLSVKQLRALLASAHIDCSHCIERGELEHCALKQREAVGDALSRAELQKSQVLVKVMLRLPKMFGLFLHCIQPKNEAAAATTTAAAAATAASRSSSSNSSSSGASEPAANADSAAAAVDDAAGTTGGGDGGGGASAPAAAASARGAGGGDSGLGPWTDWRAVEERRAEFLDVVLAAAADVVEGLQDRLQRLAAREKDLSALLLLLAMLLAMLLAVLAVLCRCCCGCC